ncbi:terpenoid cyclases/protein prenyltransferase alpha-alpha toroid [Kockovaella imperatae]|uniref:Protein farnesyltransferase subunit beta n=1 Tax=Kockovaella imperatae TaxID=4999 RepID=A0A1Y1UM34_9TREE|nr:terpenoid cyclases/protein prenyltransferase alpha-alpha toroid [Kockovaella imperatae]ORX39110.1 terpenoid cyclases/protein prenyltransferase alpha-alpha toroid [Kockovaella imperatae]
MISAGYGDALHRSIYDLPHITSHSDNHPSATLIEQEEIEALFTDLLNGVPSPGVPATSQIEVEDSESTPAQTTLRTSEHAKFLASSLFRLPAPFVALDASRPWLIYWTFHSMDILGLTSDQEIRKRAVSTIVHFMHPLGGFAGGASNTQLPHLLPTYASTCSLAIVGDAGQNGGWHQLAANRQATYDFFMRCKQPNGGFVVCQGGEVDVRGTYCLLVVATLLDLLTPELLHNVDQFIASTQTYEGGFANATFPLTGISPPRSPAMAEAHGGYTSCSLNAHFLLSCLGPPEKPSPLGSSFPKAIDIDNAVRWSVMMQGEAIEAGGFRGRSNKLVDGCYSWWVGGGFPVLEALERRRKIAKGQSVSEDGPRLFNHVALQEYTLVAAQREAGLGGGLRDKPGKRPDLYHTCNNLSGLATAQHRMVQSQTVLEEKRQNFDASKGLPAVVPKTKSGGWGSEEQRQAVRREVWANALAWVDQEESVIGGRENRVNATTPVFNLTPDRLKPFIDFFYGQSS